jgi:hypothetical protein
MSEKKVVVVEFHHLYPENRKGAPWPWLGAFLTLGPCAMVVGLVGFGVDPRTAAGLAAALAMVLALAVGGVTGALQFLMIILHQSIQSTLKTADVVLKNHDPSHSKRL